MRDFSHRLTGQVHRKVTIDVRWWPVQHFDVLRAWLDDGNLAVRAPFL